MTAAAGVAERLAGSARLSLTEVLEATGGELRALGRHTAFAGVTTDRLAPGLETPILSSAVTGVKWNVSGTFVLAGEVRWRLGKAGLTAPFTPTVSLDYLF